MLRAFIAAALSLGVAGSLLAQRGADPPAGASPLPKAAAPIDLTGYFVSVVTQDWRWRMVTPAKGDYTGIPMNLASKRVADTWDPAKDEAAGEQCKSYGAPALMSVPGRLHITWQDDTTLKVEMDAGTQTRVLHFGDWTAPRGTPPTWQGDSPRISSGARPRPLIRSRVQPARMAGVPASGTISRPHQARPIKARVGRWQPTTTTGLRKIPT